MEISYVAISSGSLIGTTGPEDTPSTHLIQHRAAFCPLPLPQEDQACNDVRWDYVKVSEKLSKQVGDFRVGILQNPEREGLRIRNLGRVRKGRS